MDPHAANPFASVSNLIPVWDSPDGGGVYEPAGAASAVEHAVHAAAEPGQAPRVPVMPPAPQVFEAVAAPVIQTAPAAETAPMPVVAAPRIVAAPEHVAPTEPAPPRSTFSYDLLAADAGPLEEGQVLPAVDYDALRRRDIAREVLRARLIQIADQREHRSAYEIVFILLATAVAILLAAPPLVQILLAAHGTQA